MEVPAWDRICERVKLIISWAMSVSRMRDSEADRFSTDTFRLLIVCSRRFWYAPSVARDVDTFLMAVSMASIADTAPAVVPIDAEFRLSDVELTPCVMATVN